MDPVPSSSDQTYNDPSSLPATSRTDSNASTTDRFLQGPQFASSPGRRRSPSTRVLAASPTYISPAPAPSASYLPTPVSQTGHFSPLLPASDNFLEQDWFGIDSRPNGPPLLRVEPVSPSPSLTTSQPVNMRYVHVANPMSAAGPWAHDRRSVAALQFDPVFGMGSRSSFTWPGEAPSARRARRPPLMRGSHRYRQWTSWPGPERIRRRVFSYPSWHIEIGHGQPSPQRLDARAARAEAAARAGPPRFKDGHPPPKGRQRLVFRTFPPCDYGRAGRRVARPPRLYDCAYSDVASDGAGDDARAIAIPARVLVPPAGPQPGSVP